MHKKSENTILKYLQFESVSRALECWMSLIHLYMKHASQILKKNGACLCLRGINSGVVTKYVVAGTRKQDIQIWLHKLLTKNTMGTKKE